MGHEHVEDALKMLPVHDQKPVEALRANGTNLSALPFACEARNAQRYNRRTMMTFCADESHDQQTYVLGGWLITPSHQDIFDLQWREMLRGLTMPSGQPCESFHTAVIMGNSKPGNPFHGWGREGAEMALSAATEVIERANQFSMQPIGVAAEIPASFKDVQRDAIWVMLFTKFYEMVLQCRPAAQAVEFVFDEKEDIKNSAETLHAKATELLAVSRPGFLAGLNFASDVDHPAIQAADLLMYEWRKRITDMRHNPDKPAREWFPRMRRARPHGLLYRYGRELFDEAQSAGDQSLTWARSVLRGDPTHRD